MTVAHFPSENRLRRQNTWWPWFVGAGLLLTLIFLVGPEALIETFRRVSVGWLVSLAGLAFVWLFLGGVNVWLLLRRLTPLPLGVFFRVYLTSWAMALLIPGQLGDASQVFLLRRHNVAMGKSGAAYLVDKTISLGWFILIALYGLYRYLPFVLTQWLLSFLLIGGGLSIVGVMIVKRLAAWSEWNLRRALSLLTFLKMFAVYPGTVALNVTGTIVKWSFMAFLYLGAFHAFGLGLRFEAAATIPVMSSLVGYLPITVGGAGTMEWTAVALFRRVGTPDVIAISVMLLLRGILLLVALFTLIIARIFFDDSQAVMPGSAPDLETPLRSEGACAASVER